MSEPRIAALHFTPRPGSPWAQVRLGMTWAEVRSLGLLRTELSHRVRQGRIVFDPPLTRKGQVIAADKGGAGVELVPPRCQVRPCLCCRRPFESEGPGNRMCVECRARNVSPYAI